MTTANPRITSFAHQLGAIVQGIVLGVLLAIALVQLAVMSSAAQVFRYQGY